MRQLILGASVRDRFWRPWRAGAAHRRRAMNLAPRATTPLRPDQEQAAQVETVASSEEVAEAEEAEEARRSPAAPEAGPEVQRIRTWMRLPLVRAAASFVATLESPIVIAVP